MAENTALTPEQKLFAERLNRMETAIGLGEPDRVPVAPFIVPTLSGPRDPVTQISIITMKKAGEAALEFYRSHPILDVHTFSGFTSGKANELAGSQMIDWPGRPGTMVSPYSSHQSSSWN